MLGFMLLVQKPLLGFREPRDLLEQIGPKDPTSLENYPSFVDPSLYVF